MFSTLGTEGSHLSQLLIKREKENICYWFLGHQFLWHHGVPERGPGLVVTVRPVGQQLSGQTFPLDSRQTSPIV